MQIIYFFKAKKIYFFLLILILFIVILIGSILYLNQSNSNQLQDTLALEQKLNSIMSIDSSRDNNNLVLRTTEKFRTLKESNATEKEKYSAAVLIADFSQSLYSRTHNPELFTYINKDLTAYAKKYFPKYYDEVYFAYSCQDPSCADTQQPREILKVIEEIKNSDFPQEVKDSLSLDLLNTGYRSKSENPGKVRQYLILASMIKSNKSFSSSSANLKIGQEIEDFVKKQYPKEYKELTQK